MGGCLSNESHEEELLAQKKQRNQERMMGVGMGVAMMMQQAGVLVGAHHLPPDPATLQAQIRKAKAEGRTVTMANGSLYFDYHLVAHIPPNYDIRV